MLRYILFMLLIDFIVHAENVDVFSYSDSKRFPSRLKRQIGIPPARVEENHKNVDIKINNHADTNDDLKKIHENAIENTDKKVANDLPNKSNKTVVEHNKNVAQSSTITINNNDTDMHIFPVQPHGKDHLGAAMRSFWVFLGLSIIVVIYFTFRAFKTRPGAPPPTTVRKYGVVGRRGDLEMLPLPLNEEEDDDTLFDVAQQNNK